MAELTLQEKMRLKTSAEGRAASLANRDSVQAKYQSQIAASKPTVTAGSVTNAGSVANGGTAAKVANNTPESQVLNQPVSGGGTKSSTVAPQQNLVKLRDTATSMGQQVGWDATSGNVSLNGNVVDVSGLQRDAQGSYMGTPEQIRAIVSQYGQAPQGYVPVRDYLTNTGTVSNEQIGFNPETRNVTVGGSELDSSNFVLVGDKYYAPEQAIQGAMLTAKGPEQQIDGQIDGEATWNETEKLLQDKIAEYEKKIQEQEKEMEDALIKQEEEFKTQAEANTYRSEITSMLNEAFQPFKYDQNSDSSLKAALTYANRQLMEELNSKGILNSTITRDQLGQVLSDLVPKYEAIAFDRYNQNVDKMFKKAEFLQRLSAEDYQRYKDYATIKIQNTRDIGEKQINSAVKVFENFRSLLKDQYDAADKEAQRRIDIKKQALEETKEFGLSNENAKILRVAPGTLTKNQMDAINKAIAEDIKAKQELAKVYATQDAQMKADIEKTKQLGQLKAPVAKLRAYLSGFSANNALEYLANNYNDIMDSVDPAAIDDIEQLIADTQARAKVEADDSRQNEQLAETKRHNSSMEANARDTLEQRKIENEGSGDIEYSKEYPDSITRIDALHETLRESGRVFKSEPDEKGVWKKTSTVEKNYMDDKGSVSQLKLIKAILSEPITKYEKQLLFKRYGLDYKIQG